LERVAQGHCGQRLAPEDQFEHRHFLCFCPSQAETILHCFWECPRVRHTWEWCSALIHGIQRKSSYPTVHFTLEWHHCIFIQQLPCRFGKFSLIWSVIRRLTLWELWIDKNARCFRYETWPLDKITSDIWSSLQDYGHIAWQNTYR
jgi:hypothetical protein